MAKRILVVLALLALAGCPAPESPGNGESPGTPEPTESPGPVAVCLEGEEFIAEGEFTLPAPGAPADAQQVSGLRAVAHAGCDRFVIDLATEAGDPATSAGNVSAEFLRDLGVVRVNLPDVPAVDPDATDAEFGGPLAKGAYVVIARERIGVYVDLHLGEPAEANVFVLSDPARVVVDLKPGGGEMPVPTPARNNVVVLSPRSGEAAYPLTVFGYARLFEANVVMRLEQGGTDAFEGFTTATAWVDGWGDYSLTIPAGPSGEVTLHVGEYSAADGTWRGVEIDLEMP